MIPGNITSTGSSVSSNDLGSKGAQAATDESDLQVWAEGRSKARKIKPKKKRRSDSSGKSFSGAALCAYNNPGHSNVQGLFDKGLESRHCQRSTGAAATSDTPARRHSDVRLAARPGSNKVLLNRPESRPQYKAPLVDIGANLAGHKFGNLPLVIANAVSAGLGSIMITGTSIAVSKMAQETVNNWLHDGLHSSKASSDSSRCALYYTVGCHPHNARDFQKDGGIAEMRKILERGGSHCIAVGECGLDYDRDWSPPPKVQIDVFEEQLELAAELKKPLFLHERKAHDDFIKSLKKYINQLPSPIMACVHCFTSNSEHLKAYLDLGCSIGITGWVGGNNNKDLVDALSSVGWHALRDRLMVETDAPFLKPYQVMPKSSDSKNEPANLPYVVHALSQVLSVDGEEIAAVTTENARRIFSLGD
ncbi:TatD family hydrolase [Endozoicomonas sp. ONNA2]|uniref:TatD family hydrolase n=1 Tax=Endozoicomonas sp. ONNA2 TaxID=2828741 RepID=UPI00214998C2|nr:TatD family hydrolase [Endozoicomonas sp. ONNA2]